MDHPSSYARFPETAANHKPFRYQERLAGGNGLPDLVYVKTACNKVGMVFLSSPPVTKGRSHPYATHGMLSSRSSLVR